MSFSADLAAMMSEVDISFDFQSLNNTGLIQSSQRTYFCLAPWNFRDVVKSPSHASRRNQHKSLTFHAVSNIICLAFKADAYFRALGVLCIGEEGS